MLGSIKEFITRRFAGRAAHEALNWLETHHHDFRISTVRDKDGPWRVKPICELTFLLTALKRHGIRGRDLDLLTEFALGQAATFDWHELAAFDPSAATPLALIADFFALEKRPAPFEMAYFEYLRQIDFFEGMDRFPYREMDLAYCYACIGIPDQQQKIKVWFNSTAFGRRQSLTRYAINDLYSLTHAIFYLTAVGQHSPADHLDNETLVRLRRELVALTAVMLRTDNVDVLGELLLCWIFCDINPTAFERLIFSAGLDRVLAAATLEGAVSPTHQLKKRADAGEATFRELYHTTLVGALLFSLVAKHKI